MVSEVNDPLGWDPVAAGNRVGDGTARCICVESYLMACIIRTTKRSALFCTAERFLCGKVLQHLRKECF